MFIQYILKRCGGIGMDVVEEIPWIKTKILLQFIAAEELLIKGGNQVEMPPTGQIVNDQLGQDRINCFIRTGINKA